MSQGSVLQGKNFLSSPTQLSAFMPWCHLIKKSSFLGWQDCKVLNIFKNLLIIIPTWGLGLVQERTFTSIPPPQDALQGVATVDQGLEIFWNKFQTFVNIFLSKWLCIAYLLPTKHVRNDNVNNMKTHQMMIWSDHHFVSWLESWIIRCSPKDDLVFKYNANNVTD